VAEFGQAAADELAANGLALVCGQDGHGGQGNGWYGAVLGFDGHAAEEDVADDFVVDLRDQGDKIRAFALQICDEIRFLWATEGGPVDGVDLLPVTELLVSDVELGIGGHGRYCFIPARRI